MRLREDTTFVMREIWNKILQFGTVLMMHMSLRERLEVCLIFNLESQRRLICYFTVRQERGNQFR